MSPGTRCSSTAMTTRMVLKPRSLDTIVATNLARGHPVGPRRSPGGLARRRADRQYRPRTALSVDVRTHSRFGLRHRRQGHREPGRLVLDGRADASSISASRMPPPGCLRAVEQVCAAGITTPDVERQRDDARGHGRRRRRHPRIECRIGTGRRAVTAPRRAGSSGELGSSSGHRAGSMAHSLRSVQSDRRAASRPPPSLNPVSRQSCTPRVSAPSTNEVRPRGEAGRRAREEDDGAGDLLGLRHTPPWG